MPATLMKFLERESLTIINSDKDRPFEIRPIDWLIPSLLCSMTGRQRVPSN